MSKSTGRPRLGWRERQARLVRGAVLDPGLRPKGQASPTLYEPDVLLVTENARVEPEKDQREGAGAEVEGEAPLSDGPLRAAAVMLDDDLVVAGEADAEQRRFADEVLAAVTERFDVPLYARVDIAADEEGRPVLMELEAIEPNLYLGTAPGAAERFARAVLAS